MKLRIPKNVKLVGLPPGTAVFQGERKIESIQIKKIVYDEIYYDEVLCTVDDVEKVDIIDKKIKWIIINGLHEANTIERVCNTFGIKQLIIEDILDTEHQPKIDFFNDFVFVTLKIIDYGSLTKGSHTEHLSLVFGKNFSLTFLESSVHYFEKIEDRIMNKVGRIAKLGTDYLNYSILDFVIDNYYILIDNLGNEIDKLEDSIVSNPQKEHLGLIHKFKSELIFLNKNIKPMRDIIRRLESEKSPLIDNSTYEYLRDLSDHIFQINDTLDSYRDTLTVMMDIYISNQGNKLNEVMKVLTIIATIFIPLTFIAGVYGMNFHFMPELEWNFGYYFSLILMLIIGLGMLFYFKRKKWF